MLEINQQNVGPGGSLPPPVLLAQLPRIGVIQHLTPLQQIDRAVDSHEYLQRRVRLADSRPPSCYLTHRSALSTQHWRYSWTTPPSSTPPQPSCASSSGGASCRPLRWLRRCWSGRSG